MSTNRYIGRPYLLAGCVSEVVDGPEPACDDGGGVGVDTVDAFEALARLLGAVVDVEFDAIS